MSFIYSAVGYATIGWGVAALAVGGTSVYNSSKNVAKKQKQSLEDANKANLAALQKEAPSVDKAGESAAAEVERKRRIRALRGGKTLLTDETLGNRGGASPKSLLGA